MWWTYLNDFVVVIVVVGGSQSRDLRSEIGFARRWRLRCYHRSDYRATDLLLYWTVCLSRRNPIFVGVMGGCRNILTILLICIELQHHHSADRDDVANAVIAGTNVMTDYRYVSIMTQLTIRLIPP